MPLYYKNQGTWETVDSPYIKQDGEWIEPEQAYIKEDGEWKLVFEQFSFDVTTKSPGQTTRNLVLKGQLNDFEGFVGERSEFFKTVFFKETELTDSTTGDAVAVDKSRGLVATGGANDTIFVYNQNLSVINGSNVSETKNFETPQVVPEPDSQINSLSFYETDEVLAAAADEVYIFEDGFGKAVSFEVDEIDGTLFTDLAFYEDGGILAAGTDLGAVYVFNKDADGNWQRNNTITNPIFGSVTSVSFRQSDGYLAAGNNFGHVYIYSDATDENSNEQDVGSFDSDVTVAFAEDGRLAVTDSTQDITVYSSGFGTTGNESPTPEAVIQNVANSGPSGALAWDDSGLLAHGSVNGNLYVYEKEGTTYENVNTFESAEKPYQSLAWDGTNEILIGGTNENQSGTFHVFSTGVQMSFRWGESGTGFPYTRRVTGFASSGKTFESRIIGLEPSTEYEFQAKGKAADGRISKGSTKRVNTPNIDVRTADDPTVRTSSVTVGGELNTFERQDGTDINQSFIGAVQYKKDKRTTWNNEVEAGIVSPNSSFTVFIDGLESDQEYDVRAKAIYGGTVAFGNSKSIKTNKVTAAFVDQNLQFDNTFTSSDTGPDQRTLTATLEESSGSGQYQVNEVRVEGINSASFSVDSSIEGETVPSTAGAEPRTNAFDVIFEPNVRLKKKAEVIVEHSAPFGNDPLVLDVTGTGEEPTTIEAKGTDFETTRDSKEKENVITISETGKDYGAVINDVREAQDSEQPEGTNTGEWDLKESSLPTELENGNNYNLQPDDSFDFNVGWNATDGNDTQVFYIQVEYESGIGDENGGFSSRELRIAVEGTSDGTVNVNVDPERNGEIIDASSEVYDFGSEITQETDRTQDTSVLDQNVTVVKDFQLVGDPASGGSEGNSYKVQHMQITGDDPGDFAILNAPSTITGNNGDSSTSVEIGESDTLTFQLEFDPSDYQNNPIEATLEVYADGAVNSAEFGSGGTPYTLTLQGEGLQPGELTTENAEDASASEPYDVGFAIAGGNPLPNEGKLPITVENISPDRDVIVASDAFPTEDTDDFRIETSLKGKRLGLSPDAVGQSSEAQVEFRPTVSKAENEGYTDGQVIRADDGSSGPPTVPEYEIFSDADVGPNPINVNVQGTFQITDVVFLDGNRTDGIEFDPTTGDSDITIAAAPGTTSTRDLTVYINNENNNVSTNAVIEDPETDPISLDPVGSDGTVSGILNINSGEPDFLTGTVAFNPQDQDDIGETQNIIVKWDNQNEIQPITVKGIAGSTIDVSIDDTPSSSGVTSTFSGTTALINYGQVTENESKLARLVVKEKSGDRSFEITTTLQIASGSGDFSIDSDSNDITDGTTLQGESKTANVLATPADGSADDSQPVSETAAFEHDADFVSEPHLESDPLDIELKMNVLNKAEVNLSDPSDPSGNESPGEVEYSAEVDATGTANIKTEEIGGDNAVTIENFQIIDNSTDFNIKNTFTGDIAAGGSREDQLVEFAPDVDTGDKNLNNPDSPDFKVDGRLEVQYSGPGTVDNNGNSASVTRTIDLRGTVIRPSTADFSSDTDNPLVITDNDGESVFYEVDGVLSNGVIATAEYTVVENNFQNGFEIEDASVVSKTINNPVNTTDTNNYSNVIDTSGGNVSVSANGSKTGTLVFDPFDSVYVGVPNDQASRNTELRIRHTAEQEGPEDGSGGSKKASNPNSDINTVDPPSLALPLSVEVRGDPVDFNTNLNENFDTSGAPINPVYSFEITYNSGFPNNCVDLFVQVPASGVNSLEQGTVEGVTFLVADNDEINNIFALTAGGGGPYAVASDSYSSNTSGSLSFQFQVSTDTNGDYPAQFPVGLYKKDPSKTRSEVTVNVPLVGDNASNYGTKIGGITLDNQQYNNLNP